MASQDLRMKRFNTYMNQLKNIGRTKFIPENNPFENDGEVSPSGTYTITGLILPTCDIYNKGYIRLDIILGPESPFKAPTVRLQTQIYHPNVAKDGTVSIRLLSHAGAWSATTSLADLVEEVIQIIDKPCTDMVLFTEAASLFTNDNVAYQKVASETYQKNPLPRN